MEVSDHALGVVYHSTPEGPRTRIVGLQGPNTMNTKEIWVLNPYYLGPWTLRVSYFRRHDVLGGMLDFWYPTCLS